MSSTTQKLKKNRKKKKLAMTVTAGMMLSPTLIQGLEPVVSEAYETASITWTSFDVPSVYNHNAQSTVDIYLRGVVAPAGVKEVVFYVYGETRTKPVLTLYGVNMGNGTYKATVPIANTLAPQDRYLVFDTHVFDWQGNQSVFDGKAQRFSSFDANIPTFNGFEILASSYEYENRGIQEGQAWSDWTFGYITSNNQNVKLRLTDVKDNNPIQKVLFYVRKNGGQNTTYTATHVGNGVYEANFNTADFGTLVNGDILVADAHVYDEAGNESVFTNSAQRFMKFDSTLSPNTNMINQTDFLNSMHTWNDINSVQYTGNVANGEVSFPTKATNGTFNQEYLSDVGYFVNAGEVYYKSIDFYAPADWKPQFTFYTYQGGHDWSNPTRYIDLGNGWRRAYARYQVQPGETTLRAMDMVNFQTIDITVKFKNAVLRKESNVSFTAPSISATPLTPTNQNPTITLTNSDPNVVKMQYKIGTNGTWTDYNTPFSISANDTIYAKGITDINTETTTSQLAITNIDKVAPTKPSFNASITSPTNANVNMTISYPSDASVKEYRINGGAWTTYTSPVTFTENGTLEARAIDQAGNISAISSYNVSNIDKLKPTNPVVVPSTTAPTKDNLTVSINYPSDAVLKTYSILPLLEDGSFVGDVNGDGQLTPADVLQITKVANGTLVISQEDIPKHDINKDGSVTSTDSSLLMSSYVGSGANTKAYTSPFVLTENSMIIAHAKDEAGNISQTYYKVENIDKTAPVNATFSPSTTAPTNQNVSVTINYPSDATVKQYKIGSTGTWTTYTTPVVASANNTVYARSYDAVGNVSAETSLSLTNIDKTAPNAPIITADVTTPTNGNVILTGTFASDAEVTEYSIDGGKTWMVASNNVYTMTANGNIQARSKDSAGNYSAVTTYTVTNIDKTAPNIPTISADMTNPTNGNVVLSASYPSDAIVKEYSLNGGTTWLAYTSPVTFTANGTFHVRAKDNAGNVSAVGSYTVSNIDKTAPANASLVASTTASTNQDVTVSISYPSDASVKQYKIGSTGSWTTYTAPVVVSSNNTVYTRSYDAVGNVSNETSYTVTNIDKVAPTTPSVSADVTTATNGNVILTATFPSDSSVEEYRVNNGSWTSYITPITMTENGVFEARAKDVAGNYSTITSYEVTNIDKIAPTIATLTASTISSTNQDVNVTISYPNDASVKQYKIGSNGAWTTYTSPVVLSSNNTVYARSIDAVGNISPESNLVVSNIDKVAPTTPTVSADVTIPTNGDVVLTAIFPSDASKKEYSLNNGLTWNPYTTPITMTTNGTMQVRATDQAGNVSAIGFHTVSNIDKTPPANATLTANKTNPTNSDVTVTISYPSDASVKQYKVGSGGTWTSYTTPVVVSANSTVYARSVDSVGNVSAETSLVISNIDKVAPTTPSISADVTEATNRNVLLTASFPLDATVKEYRLNGGSWTPYTLPVTMTDNGKMEVRATDQAGNISTIGSYEVTNIDKTAPIKATLSASTTSLTNQAVSVSVSYPVDAVTKQYKIGSTGTWTAYTTPIVVNDNTTVYARSIDAVGNISDESNLVINNIDKIAPTTPTFVADKTAMTNTDVKVTVTYPADAMVKEVKVNGGSWMAYTTPIVMTANGTIEARGKDEAGNLSTVSTYAVSNIDKTAPVNPTFVASTTAPTNQDVSVTVNFPSDVSVKQYKIGSNGTWMNYTGPVVLSANNTIYARGYDHVGNASQEVTFDVSNIDKTAPANATFMADKTSETNQDVKVTISYPTDASIKQYKVGNAGTWTAYTTPVVVTANDTVYARSYDAVGNVSSESSYLVNNIDKIAPTKPTLVADKTNPTNTNVVVTATFPSDSVKNEVRVNGGTWTAYTSPITMTENGKVEVRSMDKAGNLSVVASYEVTNIDKTIPAQPESVMMESENKITLTGDEGSKIFYRLNDGEWKEYTSTIAITDGSYKVNAKIVDPASNESEMATWNVTMYRDGLATAVSHVQQAEVEQTQEAVYLAKEKVNAIPESAPEKQPLMKRLNDIQALIDARNAIQKAIDSRNEEDVQEAKDKIDLLDGSNPIIIDILDEIQEDLAEADILTFIAKERYDILSTKYQMSKESYNALVQIYYAIKYTGDTMYKMAGDKVALVSVEDKHYEFVHEQYEKLINDYNQFVDDRVATDAEIKAESSVKVMEANYDPTYAVNTQALINKVEDATIRASLQKRLDDAKARYETSQLDKASQSAMLAVEKAESTKQTYYVSEAYKKVNVLTNATLKAELTSRLQALESQMVLERKISDATRTVELAEQYKYDSYITSAQTKVSALPNGEIKTSLQQRLDALKSGQATGEQATIIKQATNYVSLAYSLKTQYYVDKAQGYVNQILDPVKKAELQAKLDSVVVK